METPTFFDFGVKKPENDTNIGLFLDAVLLHTRTYRYICVHTAVHRAAVCVCEYVTVAAVCVCYKTVLPSVVK